jgi:hypothetical protein
LEKRRAVEFELKGDKIIFSEHCISVGRTVEPIIANYQFIECTKCNFTDLAWRLYLKPLQYRGYLLKLMLDFETLTMMTHIFFREGVNRPPHICEVRFQPSSFYDIKLQICSEELTDADVHHIICPCSRLQNGIPDRSCPTAEILQRAGLKI